MGIGIYRTLCGQTDRAPWGMKVWKETMGGQVQGGRTYQGNKLRSPRKEVRERVTAECPEHTNVGMVVCSFTYTQIVNQPQNKQINNSKVGVVIFTYLYLWSLWAHLMLHMEKEMGFPRLIAGGLPHLKGKAPSDRSTSGNPPGLVTWESR